MSCLPGVDGVAPSPIWCSNVGSPSVSHRDPFVLAKLQREEGLYLIHWSCHHFHRLILTVAQRDQVGLGGRSWPSWAGVPLPGPRVTPPPTPILRRPLRAAPRAGGCASSPSNCNKGNSRWRAGVGPSPVCGTCGMPCRAAHCGLAQTASPYVAAACHCQEVGITRG